MSDDPFLALTTALGLSDDDRACLSRAAPPTEGDIADVAWAVDLSIADDWMIPAVYETMNGVPVPRRSFRHEDGSYMLQPSRVKRDTEPILVGADAAPLARARYLLWKNYYIRAYGTLGYTSKQSVCVLYFGGSEPPKDPRASLIEAKMRRALWGVR
jgi:hypothetical protein